MVSSPNLLFDPPKVFGLPVSMGADIIVDFQNRVVGSEPATYEDWPAGWVVTLGIGVGVHRVTATATVSTHHAVCRIESAVADGIKAGWPWFVAVSIPGSTPGEFDDVVALNGTVVRADGA